MERRWVLLAGCLLAGAVAGKERSPVVTNVAVVDFAVTGYGEPRYWLGPLYAETLARRMVLCENVLVIEPLQIRQQPATTSPQTVEAVTERCREVMGRLRVPFVLGGLIEDAGEKLRVTVLAVSTATPQVFPLVQEVTWEQRFLPQLELVVKRFLPNMGVRLSPVDVERAAGYDPMLTAETERLVGDGWRAYAPAEPEDAFRLWHQALHLDPTCRLAREALAGAGLLYRRLLLARATEYYQQRVAEEDGDPIAHYHLGEILAEGGQWPEAEAQFRRAMGLRNTYLEAYNGLTRALIAQSRLEEAFLSCEGTLKLFPDNLIALHNKAVVLYKRGMVGPAKEVWGYILKIDPNNDMARDRLQRYGRPGETLPQ